MLGSLMNYLFRGNLSNSEESYENDALTSHAIMRKFRQTDVEGDDWVLINRAGEGTSALEESWYVTPPACFTQVEPVVVETSPMENLLIEHPSMSVYRATTSRIAPNTPPPTPVTLQEREESGHILLLSLIMSSRSTSPASLDTSPGRGVNSDFEELAQREGTIHNDRSFASERNEKVRIPKQIRSAEKVLQKRSTQKLKKGRLDKNNKVRQITGKRLRRQDRLRVQNSGANNNRKC